MLVNIRTDTALSRLFPSGFNVVGKCTLKTGLGIIEMKQALERESLTGAVGQLVARASHWKKQGHDISALIVVTSREEALVRGLGHLQKLAAEFESGPADVAYDVSSQK